MTVMAESEIIRLAKQKACEEFLNQHDIQLVERKDCWIVNFIPKSRQRGGGLRVKISKETLEVVELTYFQ